MSEKGRPPRAAVILSLLTAVGLSACANPAANAPKLIPIQALPKPTLPPWIASISPTGTADTLAQVRVIFGKPVTAVEALSGDGPRDVLSHVSIAPALRGHFTVLTPRMIGFVPDQALPIGTRVRITLAAGLHDLDGDRLDQDLAWTFETPALSFTNMPQLSGPRRRSDARSGRRPPEAPGDCERRGRPQLAGGSYHGCSVPTASASA